MTDREGRLWVVTNLGVQRYNPSTDSFESVLFGEGTTANVNDILQTPEGEIWLLHAQEGPMRVEGLTARPLEMAALSGDCNNMLLDSCGRLWIAYQERGVLLYDTTNKTSRTLSGGALDKGHVVDLAQDARGRILALTDTAILAWDGEQFLPQVTYPRKQVHRLYPQADGSLLFTTVGSGIWKAAPGGHSAEPLEDNTHWDLSSAKINAVLLDRNGNRWLGCYQLGLIMLEDRPVPFHFLPLSQMETDNGQVLRSIYADDKGHTYICQENGGVASIDHEGRTLGHWMGQYTVNTLYPASEGSLWVGTYQNGLYRLDLTTGKETRYPLTGTQRISGITRDRDGNLYTACFGEGLRSYTPDGQTERPLSGGSLELINPYLNTLFTDAEGLIWIGHYYGIDVYDPAGDTLLNLPIPETLRPAIVYQIGQSPADHSIWVGSNKGLFQFYPEGPQQGTWKRFTTVDGLPNNIINGFSITPDGTLWAGTYRGLAQISPQGHVTRYYRGNGLQEWSYLRGVSAFSAYGEVILGNQNGITYFIPEALKQDGFLSGITLTAMRLGNSFVHEGSRSGAYAIIHGPLEEAREITVSYQDNTFSLRFSPMDFRDPQSVHYEFRYAGEAKDQWYITESGRSELYFSHMGVGRHRLIVRAYDNGVYSPEKQLLIRVMPPWYRTWWAYVLYLVILAAMALQLRRHYWNKRQAEANEEKIKFFVDISHELRSPLTLIKGPLSQLLATPHDAQTTRALRNMERNTNRLLTLTGQILSIRKMEKGQMTLHFAQTPLADFVADICHDYDYQTEKRQVTLHFQNDAPETAVWIDRDNFDKVVTNLINNAIKYTGENGHIDVIVREEGRFAELQVRDDGPGIDEAQLKKIFERFYQTSARPAAGQMSYGIGLNLTQKIVALHGGGIQAQNRTDGQGSVFTVRLPLGTGHLPQDQLVEEDYFAGGAGTDKPLPVTDAERPRKIRRKTTYHIAVVDDDEEIRSFLETELGESYHVHAYPDGQKALEGIVETVPDLVVSDIVMPVMDGVELLKRLKASTTTSHIPVILLTTKTEHASRIKGLEEGADAYVDKPFNLEELETRIAGLIANRARMKGKFSGAQEQQDTVRQVELKGNDAALMERIMKAINERLDDSEFNVEALGDAVGLSRVQLHRRVKDITGITVGEFIRNLRLQQAARLLEEGDTTVSQVTYAVGFANPTHFSAAFKKHFGVTPSEYLAKAKQKR